MKKSKSVLKIMTVAGAAGLLSLALFLPGILRNYQSNVQEKGVLYVPPGATFEMVKDSISPYLKELNTFVSVAERLQLPQTIKPGRYVLETGMQNKEVVRMLQKGWQTPMMLTLSGNIRNTARLAALLGKRLAADSAAFAAVFADSLTWTKYGFNRETFPALFIPNSYEVYWTITPEQFLERMKKEYDRFWNQERLAKAQAIGLTPVEVSILAAIVCEESNYRPEQPTIAGVYMNRLKIGMKLDADPTVKFAVGDPTLRRILYKHLEVDSPYNTYKNTGLPPGLITIPGVSCLDAVLNYEPHRFLYFCANASLNGTHKFAVNLSEHNRNAREYQVAVSRMGIR